MPMLGTPTVFRPLRTCITVILRPLGMLTLKPEEALTTELGMALEKLDRFELTTADIPPCCRKDLIDYVRASDDGRFEATTIRKS